MQKNDTPPETDAISRLIRLIETYAPHEGAFDLPIPGVRVVRISQPDIHPQPSVSQPGLCIIAQGAKRVVLGEQVFEYGQSNMVVYSMALPIKGRIVQASAGEPYLCFVIDIIPQKIGELATKVFPRGIPKMPDMRGIQVGQADDKIVDAAIRLIETVKNPKETALLSAMFVDEIFTRLLLSEIGAAVAQIGATDSNTAKVVKAISWIKENYAEPLSIDDLTKLVNMSESPFHRHFKAVTSMSPVQFQKMLRLQEAKNLLITEMVDVTTASQRVGYASSSQFSREYSRFFGVPPSKDAAKAKQ